MDGPALAHAETAIARPRVRRERPAPGPSPVATAIRTPTDAVAVAEELHGALWKEYAAVIKDPVRGPPAGRAFFIYTAIYLPWLRQNAASFAPTELAKVAFRLVAQAREHARTEESAKPFLEPAKHPKLFPEHEYAQFHAAAEKLRTESSASRETAETAKWAVLGAKKEFVMWAQVEYWRGFAADILEREGLERRGGRGSSLSLERARDFASTLGWARAETVSEKEFAAYVSAEARRREIWSHQARMRPPESLSPERAKAVAELGDVGADLVTYEGMAVDIREKASEAVFPAEVRRAWRDAQIAIVALVPLLGESKPLPEAVTEPARRAVKHFFVRVADWATPGIGAPLRIRVDAVHNARSAKAWRRVYADYREALAEMDDRIVSGLRASGEPAQQEAQRLAHTGKMARALEELHETHAEARRVDAVFRPAAVLRNEGKPGAPDFRALSIPMSFYVFREGKTWHLVDLYHPGKPRENTEDGRADQPPQALFDQLDRRLRFPEGHLSLNLTGFPIGSWYDVPTTNSLSVSEWLTWLGLGLTVMAAVAAAIPTGGASVAATVLLVSSGLVGAAAGVADLVEKSEQGMLTTTTVVLDVASIAANLAGATAAGAGKIISVAAQGAPGGIARLAVAVQFVRQPALAANIAANSIVLMAFTAESFQMYREIEESSAPDSEKRTAQRRLVALTLFNGGMTLLSVKNDLAAFKDSPGLVLDFTRTRTGQELAVARPILSEAQMRARLSMIANLEGFLADVGRLEGPALQRFQAQLSLVAATGQLASPTVKAALKGATTQEVMRFLELAHIDQYAAQVLLQMSGSAEQVRAAVLGTEFELAKSLVKEKPAALRSPLIWGRYPTVAALADQIRRVESWVGYTRGVYEGVDGPPPGWRFMDEKGRPEKVATLRGGVREITTWVQGPGGSEGKFVRRYNRKTGEFVLAEAFRGSLPSHVTGAGVPLIPGRGTPTVIYMSLYQMRRLMAAAGHTPRQVRSVRLAHIQNVETIVELNWLMKQYPSVSPDQLVTQTSSYRYAVTVMTQAGLEPVPSSARIELAEWRPSLESILEEQGADREALMKAYGFSPQDKVITNFDITFDVRPRAPE